MKRAILIATGTVGGLGAVLAITPPQFTSTQSASLAMPDAGTTTAPSEQAPAAATPTPDKTATTSKTKTRGKDSSYCTGTGANNKISIGNIYWRFSRCALWICSSKDHSGKWKDH